MPGPVATNATHEHQSRLMFSLPVRFTSSKGITIAHCDVLDVVSQGPDREHARHAITEAVSLFLETCYDMGTLNEVLRDCGFSRMHESHRTDTGAEMIDVPMELVANAAHGAHKRRPTR